jgi:hypothetical protein
MADVSRFETRMTWDGRGNGHWDVVLSGMGHAEADPLVERDGRQRDRATIARPDPCQRGQLFRRYFAALVPSIGPASHNSLAKGSGERTTKQTDRTTQRARARLEFSVA